MKYQQIISKVFSTLPAAMISLFFLANASDKILDNHQTGKIIENSGIMKTAGIFLLMSLILFLYRKTMLVGTAFLVLYMIMIVGIHMFKGKPFEIALLIVVGTIFSTYIRKPSMFQKT